MNRLEEPESVFVIDQTIIEDTHHLVNPQPVNTITYSQCTFHPVSVLRKVADHNCAAAMISNNRSCTTPSLIRWITISVRYNDSGLYHDGHSNENVKN